MSALTIGIQSNVARNTIVHPLSLSFVVMTEVTCWPHRACRS